MNNYTSLSDFITLDGYDELVSYADRLTRYLKECLE